MGTKTSNECEVHYYSFYYKSAKDNVPSLESIIAERDENGRLVNDCKKAQEALAKAKQYVSKKESKIKQSPEELKKPPEIKIDGFMPLRGDFNVEYDNDAELLLADMEFFDDDTEAEKKLKDDVLKLYNEKLDERITRKKFVIENGLLDIKKQHQRERNRPKEEREVYAQMKSFMRFCSEDEFQELVEGLVEEKRLRQRLEELKMFRSLGLVTFEQVERYLEKKHDGSEFLIGKYPLPAAKGHNVGRVPRTKEGQITSAAGYTELDEREKELCLTLTVQPEVYLGLKKKLTAKREKQKLTKSMVLDLVDKEIAKDKAFAIYDFMLFHKIITNCTLSWPVALE
eukprot:TRINITY_DN14663_c0_g1_i1.p2 TRINITY_DN14663_c0_g1~~TRINITY_DN14663_c0_g1_i1.p2  ORF type:complete len:342 (-),score=111.79 TRINITY_DN14663_c0_g1_i1:111-1136(-)